MTCEDLQRFLNDAGVADVAGAAERAEDLFQHLTLCDRCLPEWRDLRRQAATWRRPPGRDDAAGDRPGASAGPHPTSDQMWAVVDPGEGALTPAARAAWRHVLECDECLDVVIHLRQSRTPDGKAPAEHVWTDVWNAFRGLHTVIACVWVGAALRVKNRPGAIARGDERVASGGVSVPLRGENLSADLWIEPVSGETRAARIRVTLRGDPTPGLQADFYRDGHQIQSRSFHQMAAELVAAGSGHYRLEIVDATGATVCAADLEIGVDADAS